jgi:hypothetical protein
MASQKQIHPRVKAFVAAVLAERPHDDTQTINDIELAMEELADAVADEFAAQLLARQAAADAAAAKSGPTCPHCGRAGHSSGTRRREILTTRGSAPLVESKCYCAACRRNFFPSLPAFGTGE